MGYFDVDVIVDGALDASETFSEDDDDMRQFLLKVEADAKADGLPTEVYVVYHGHEADGDECSCVQYLTDMRPEFTYNMEAE